ncbi:plasmid mobilization protein [Bifidobacterium fermentum]|uniref:Plasmid mobilization relaxosome protein MobC n=1 Tax=Bifidobacterium fermentum TaxID=3059035 RepID=A0AB39UF45_9BIFI
MSTERHRNKSVQKKIRFTPDEWNRVEAMLTEVRGYRPMTWNEFASRSVLGKRIVRVVLPFDPKKVTREINKLGVNVNQIAARVNAQDYATLAEVEETQRLLSQVQEQLHDCWQLMKRDDR